LRFCWRFILPQGPGYPQMKKTRISIGSELSKIPVETGVWTTLKPVLLSGFSEAQSGTRLKNPRKSIELLQIANFAEQLFCANLYLWEIRKNRAWKAGIFRNGSKATGTTSGCVTIPPARSTVTSRSSGTLAIISGSAGMRISRSSSSTGKISRRPGWTPPLMLHRLS